MPKRKTTKRDFSKPRRLFWIIFLGGIAAFLSVFLFASYGAFGPMPDHTALENPRTNLATEILSSDGLTLGKFYYEDNRTPVSYQKLPKHLVDALIATEDIRYFDHAGIDARGTLRAVFKLGKGGGASTISQQLAKQLFHGEGSRNTVGRII